MLLLPTLRRCSGFTLVELLGVVSIIAVLAALVVPALSRAIDASRRSVCAANLRQVFVALQGYGADNDQTLPTLGGSTPGTWEYYLRPYISGYNQYGGTLSGKGGSGPYVCPAWENRLHGNTKAGHYGLNGMFYNTSRIPYVKLTGITRPEQTIMAGDMCWWPAQNQSFADIMPSLLPGTSYQAAAPEKRVHANGAANLLFCDGHVEFWPDVTILSQAIYDNHGPQDVWSYAK